MAGNRSLHAEQEFTAPTDGGELVGWLRDGPSDSPPALLLHGGPGLSEYLQPLADELDGLFPIARYQQRGVEPSLTGGPRDVARHVADTSSVLAALGWDRAMIIGHSWGGHLAMHFAVANPERLHSVVSIDPLGGVGDGGLAAFVETLASKVPANQRERYKELEALESQTDAEREESFRMVWPYYFANPEQAAPFPTFRFDPSSEQTWGSINDHFDDRKLELQLPQLTAPFLLIHGEESPIPISEAARTVDLMPNARLVAVPDSGHWPWLERPGFLRDEISTFMAQPGR
jgi:proline iminopeptidase